MKATKRNCSTQPPVASQHSPLNNVMWFVYGSPREALRKVIASKANRSARMNYFSSVLIVKFSHRDDSTRAIWIHTIQLFVNLSREIKLRDRLRSRCKQEKLSCFVVIRLDLAVVRKWFRNVATSSTATYDGSVRWKSSPNNDSVDGTWISIAPDDDSCARNINKERKLFQLELNPRVESSRDNKESNARHQGKPATPHHAEIDVFVSIFCPFATLILLLFSSSLSPRIFPLHVNSFAAFVCVQVSLWLSRREREMTTKKKRRRTLHNNVIINEFPLWTQKTEPRWVKAAHEPDIFKMALSMGSSRRMESGWFCDHSLSSSLSRRSIKECFGVSSLAWFSFFSLIYFRIE